MEFVKKTSDYIIIKKRSGRYGVRKKNGAWVNGEDKAKILATEGLVKLTEASKKEEPAEESAPAESNEEPTAAPAE